jgi:hypothetical protein
MFVLSILGWIAQSVAFLAEIVAYSLQSIWISMVRATLSLIEGVDEWLPGLEILDNPLLRGLAMGVVGFFLGIALMVFLSFVTGNWGIPCVFLLVILACAFLGLVADPEGDWDFPAFPSFGGSGPKTPMNL